MYHVQPFTNPAFRGTFSLNNLSSYVLILDVSLLDPVILAGLNILSVTIGMLAFEKVKEKNYVKNIS